LKFRQAAIIRVGSPFNQGLVLENQQTPSCLLTKQGVVIPISTDTRPAKTRGTLPVLMERKIKAWNSQPVASLYLNKPQAKLTGCMLIILYKNYF
jgi:hypothetical protein